MYLSKDKKTTHYIVLYEIKNNSFMFFVYWVPRKRSKEYCVCFSCSAVSTKGESKLKLETFFLNFMTSMTIYLNWIFNTVSNNVRLPSPSIQFLFSRFSFLLFINKKKRNKVPIKVNKNILQVVIRFDWKHAKQWRHFFHMIYQLWMNSLN